MFNYRKIGENVAAAALAVVLSAVSVGAAVGPAQTVQSGSSLQASAPAATARA
jgi:serine acetyltransferase